MHVREDIKCCMLSPQVRQVKIIYVCFTTTKYDTWSIIFDQVLYLFQKINRRSIALGRVFSRPSVVLDIVVFVEGFSTKKSCLIETSH